MRALYTPAASHQELFAEADGAYSAIKAALVSTEWSELDHGEIERRLHPEGMELLRQLIQSHYTLRGQAKPTVEVVGSDGQNRTHVRSGTSRQVETIFGEVVAVRDAHSGRGLSALHPVDADLNLPASHFSHEVERRVALDAAEKSFESTMRSIERTTGASIAKRQIEELTLRAASDFEEFYGEREIDPTRVHETGPLLILSFDQKGVVMRPEDLREATRKLAQRKRRKLQTRYCKGEPHGRKRMSTVATVYSIDRHHRSAQDVIDGLRRIRDVAHKQKPKPEYKRVWASLKQHPLGVIRDAFEEALKRDPDDSKRWYVLIDGDEDLERWVNAAAREHGVEVTIGLDVIHALQYLWKAGMAFHGEGTPALEEWVLERLFNVLHGKVSDVAAGMRRSATLRELEPEVRAAVDKCADYFLARTHMMKYDELLAAGAPIATGVIEGACRYLVKDRLDITGATWSLEGAEAVLRLRAIVTSGDFDEYWRYHEEQERHYNHAIRYANERPPEVAQPALGKRRLRRIK